MNNHRWDITDAISPDEDLTERQRNPKRYSRVSAQFSAAVIVMSCAFAFPETVVVPFSDSTSDVISVVHRALRPDVPRTVARMSEADLSVDFERARTGESLARAFDAYFRPPLESESEIEPDASCFF